MSNFFTNQEISNDVKLAHRLQAVVNGTPGSGESVRTLVSMENHTPEAVNTLTKNLRGNAASIESIVSEVRASNENFDTEPSSQKAARILRRAYGQAIRAAAIVAEAAKNPVAYVKRKNLVRGFKDGTQGQLSYETATYGIGSSLGIVNEENSFYATESFDNTELLKAIPYSIALAFRAAQQSEFTEGFYPTVVIPADSIGYVAEARVPYIIGNGMTHDDVSKLNPDSHKRMLLEAYRDPSVFRTEEGLKLVPWYVRDAKGNPGEAGYVASTAEYFSTKVQPITLSIRGTNVLTAPLVPGKDVNLFALCSHPGLVKNGGFNETDQLDVSTSLTEVNILVKDKILRFPTVGLMRTNFIRALEGNSRELVLNFESDEFTLNKSTLDQDGVAIEELAAITKLGFQLRLRISLNASLNANTSVLRNVYGNVSLVEIRDTNGNLVSPEDTRIKNLLTTLGAFTFDSYQLLPRLSNTNLRVLGPIVDSYTWVERYIVGIRTPITVQRSLYEEDGQSGLDELIAITRVRQDQDALSTLFDYRNTLSSYVDSIRQERSLGEGRRIPNFIGLGKYVIEKAFYQFEVIDLKRVVASLSSNARKEDVDAALTNHLQERAAFMYRETGLFIAHMLDNNGKAVKPHVLIGTDAYLSKFFNVKGDTRTMGEGFDYSVVVSPDHRMTNRIFMTFTRPDKDGFDYLSFGNTLMCPELVTTVRPYQKSGGVVGVTTHAARYAYINNLPILYEAVVVNMDAVFNSQQQLGVITMTPNEFDTAYPKSTINGKEPVNTVGAGNGK